MLTPEQKAEIRAKVVRAIWNASPVSSETTVDRAIAETERAVLDALIERAEGERVQEWSEQHWLYVIDWLRAVRAESEGKE